ncbi:MAG TPA: TetR/AcrR family transcriptional regulator [Acidimicrobiales bacterium]|nr:TetR/AcrR family transcriptional regulator [Acidimicrobiales bacterium]
MPRQAGVTDATDARTDLLARAVELAGANGLSDVSLRQMAAELGTSHRMLIYHFGSKEGLLVAVINEMERRQLEAMEALDADPSLSPAEQVRSLWTQLADPALWPHERLFFEVYGQALQGRAHAARLLDTVVESWLAPATRIGVRHGMTKRAARANARLGLAVVRGLLLDLLATGDRKGCDDALERYLATLP